MGVLSLRFVKKAKIRSGITPDVKMSLVARPKLAGRISPAGASRIKVSTMCGNAAAKFAAMPPPSEYPMMLKALLPVQESRDEARTSRICVV